MIEIRREDLSSPSAQLLILELNAELSAIYPEQGATHFRLDYDEVAAGRGAFVVAYWEARPVGCGGVRRLDAQTAELKRMYVRPDARTQGVGRLLLAALEGEALNLGARRLVLETGDRLPGAMALYTRAGFTRIPAFGEYVDSPLSVCLGKTL